MNERRIIEEMGAAAHAEGRLQASLMDGYGPWEDIRRDTRLGIRNAALAACVALLLALPTRAVAAQRYPSDKMSVSGGAGYMEMYAVGTQMVEAL